jgi:predicted RNA-binding protein with RPS1 domain
LTIRVVHIEENVEKYVRYINGLRYDIQDKISILFMKIVEDSYQVSLKAEETLARKQSHKVRERGSTRSKGQSNGRGRFHIPGDEGGILSSSSQPSRGRRFFSRGREIRCYTCGKTRNMSWDYLENKSTTQRNENVAEAKEENVNTNKKEEVPEVGESLLMKRMLLK